MAEFILFLLMLALVAGQRGPAVAAPAWDDVEGDMQQRQETMAEVLKVFSNPASAAAADSPTVHKAAAFLKREMGPLAPIFRAISKMPKNTAAEVRSKDKAFDAAQELMHRHMRQLLVPHDSAETDDDDDDLAEWQQAMADVVRLSHQDRQSVAAADAKTTRRLVWFLKREMGPLEDIYFAIRDMPENNVDDVRVKDEAFDGFMELLDRKFRLLLPHGRPNAGFAVGKMPETTADEIRGKEEARAAARELVNRYLGPLRPGGGSVKINDDL